MRKYEVLIFIGLQAGLVVLGFALYGWLKDYTPAQKTPAAVQSGVDSRSAPAD